MSCHGSSRLQAPGMGTTGHLLEQGPAGAVRAIRRHLFCWLPRPLFIAEARQGDGEYNPVRSRQSRFDKVEALTTIDFLFDGSEGAGLTSGISAWRRGPNGQPVSDFFAIGAGGRRLPHRPLRVSLHGGAPGRRQSASAGSTNVLLDTWRCVIDVLGPDRLVIGGKSLGGRMASMIADTMAVRGLICLGYPFHPPGQPESCAPVTSSPLRTPALILQGTRDPFGGQAEVAGYALSTAIRLEWLADGDHGFMPRVASGRTDLQNRQQALASISAFLQRAVICSMRTEALASYERNRPALRLVPAGEGARPASG